MAKHRQVVDFLFVTLLCAIIAGNLGVGVASGAIWLDGSDYVPAKWAVIVFGGYNYYRDLRVNALQRIEKIMQGRGAPYDFFTDDDIVAPTDNPAAGRYALQYANGTLRYQAVVLLFDWEYMDNSGVNQNYVYWAVGNGTNAVIFNKAARAVPALLGLSAADVGWMGGASAGAIETLRVLRTFNDQIREYAQGSVIALGANLYYHAIIRKTTGMSVWVNKTWGSNWSLGMANTTYGQGDVWYLGYSLHEWAMETAAAPQRYYGSWSDWKMDFWAHSINFVLNNSEQIPVRIMPFKRWKGAWIIRIDTDSPQWKNAFLPPESVLQSGWVFDYQYNVLGSGRITNFETELSLINGAPAGYAGMPSSRIMYTTVTGVLQTNLINNRNYRAIVYNSTIGGSFDRIKLDFNENGNFADDVAYRVWENMTYPTVQGKLYWCSATPNLVSPTRINVGWWQTPMLVENEAVNLPKWRQYGADYGLSYSFHGWQHLRISDLSSYGTWNGASFVLDAAYINEKLNAARYWMADKFGGTGYGFEEDEVIISHPFNEHPSEVDAVIDSLPWVLFQYPEPLYFVGFAQKSATAKYLLTSSNDESFYQYSHYVIYQDMIETLYPMISTYTHRLNYNASLSFPPYTDSIKPANPREAFRFWLNARDMLTNVRYAYYKSGRIILDFTASSNLEEFVWRFPTQYDGREFSGFSDNRLVGQVKHTDSKYVYIEFSQGQGTQRVEVTYGTPVPQVTVTVGQVAPLNAGTTNPATAQYSVNENSMFTISATPSQGYLFDHWELDSVNIGSSNPYSFNVSTVDHTISAYFTQIPTVSVTVLEASPANTGTSNPAAGTYTAAENSLFSIAATPNLGYNFDHWELDGSNVGSVNPYSLNVGISDHTIGAFFVAMPPLTVTVNPVSSSEGGTTNPTAGQYQVAQNAVFQISATASQGYIFDHWELDSVTVGTQPSYSFNVGASDHTIGGFFRSAPTQVQIDSCDSLQGWGATSATLSLDSTDFMEGTSSILVTPTTPLSWHSYAAIGRSMSFSSYSSLQMWIKVSDASRSLRLTVATDWSNYNTYVITGLTSNAWTLVTINLSAPTSRTGSVNLGSIAFIRFDYSIALSPATLRIDDIRGILA